MKTDKGFTLIELMITILVFSVIISAVYASHISQQRTYQVQEQVAQMQQHLRVALNLMASDIRMAGYDPSGGAGAGITAALPGYIRLLIDKDGSGALDDSKETIEYGFSVASDADRNGIPDDGNIQSLGRQYSDTGGYQAIANNLQAIELLYFDSDGNATTVTDDIRAIQITLLARTERPDPEFLNTRTYKTGWGPYNDNYRRRMLTTTIRCRNLGL